MNCIEVNGLKFNLRPDSSDEKAITEVVKNKGYERKYFKVESGEYWLDLGANIGAFTCFAIQRGATVTAYEPEPNNFAALEANVALNGYVAKLVQAAVVADRIEQTELNLYLADNAEQDWCAGLYKHHRKRSVVVPACKFSSILHGIDAVKMDIEGAEIDILNTVAGFGSVKKLVLEYHFSVRDDVNLYRRIMKRLEGMFANVNYKTFPEHIIKHPYFIPDPIIFAWNE